MSQYLHMIEREVSAYRPDWVIVLLVHNDFDEFFAPSRAVILRAFGSCASRQAKS